ncbi:MAG: hypothetical protein V1734_03935 [Nanoarchaeota archaeon]
MKNNIQTALKTLEILLENPEELKDKAENAISHGKKANEILKKYMRLSSMPEWDYATEEKELALKPNEITEFFEKSKVYKANKMYAGAVSDFTTRLVKESYKKGGNGFVLDANGINGLEDLCNGVEGKKKRKLSIEIKGETGEGCCSVSQYCIVTIEKPDYRYGLYAIGSNFRLQSRKHAEKVVAALKDGAKTVPPWHYTERVRNNESNKVYLLKGKDYKLFWSEDCAKFKQEMKEHAKWLSDHAPDREPD